MGTQWKKAKKYGPAIKSVYVFGTIPFLCVSSKVKTAGISPIHPSEKGKEDTLKLPKIITLFAFLTNYYLLSVVMHVCEREWAK